MFPAAGKTEDICSCCTSGKDLSGEEGRRDSKDVFLEEGESVLLESGSERFGRKMNLYVGVGEGDEVVGKERGRGGATYWDRGEGEIDVTGVLYGTFRQRYYINQPRPTTHQSQNHSILDSASSSLALAPNLQQDAQVWLPGQSHSLQLTV